jgi:hypothetical protein
MKKVSFYTSRKKIISLWLLMSLAIFIIFFIQTLTGKYTDNVKDVWQWLFQFLLPALTLMLGVLIAQFNSTTTDFEVDSFYFKLAFGISIFFLVFLFLSPIIIPILHVNENVHRSIAEQKDILQSFKTVDNFLLPLQGITMLSLGIFFSKK